MRLYGVCAKMQGYLGALCAALILKNFSAVVYRPNLEF